jgi:hypothetical protein
VTAGTLEDKLRDVESPVAMLCNAPTGPYVFPVAGTAKPVVERRVQTEIPAVVSTASPARRPVRDLSTTSTG